MITPNSLREKEVNELNLNEIALIHLNKGFSVFETKEYFVRSTLSFAIQNVKQALNLDNSNQLMPYITLCAILEQIGICYDRKDKEPPKFTNGLKRALIQFGEIDENDELINVIYALRNGLLHNISLTSFDRKRKKHYKFRYNFEIDSIYKNAEEDWNGCYKTLDTSPKKYTTQFNVELFSDVVFSCIDKVNEINLNDKLVLRLEGGLRQLFFDYLLTLKK